MQGANTAKYTPLRSQPACHRLPPSWFQCHFRVCATAPLPVPVPLHRTLRYVCPRSLAFSCLSCLIRHSFSRLSGHTGFVRSLGRAYGGCAIRGSSRRGLWALRSAVEDRRPNSLSILGIGALCHYDAFWVAGKMRNFLDTQLWGPSRGSALLGVAATTQGAFNLRQQLHEGILARYGVRRC
ncbi:hypothetical protein DAEQUDRAFT_75723 [Daedalea quercina L-15889]|uniref:Uncharacterized protein n=1 Tax=Daedalea quercina L-15889 TaxID=1314783 RepID=A0A165SE94_9APHY|nr:hypothetical protein DAEQUDRAFT_75723 [Daedalea quercina L-15889]